MSAFNKLLGKETQKKKPQSRSAFSSLLEQPAPTQEQRKHDDNNRKREEQWKTIDKKESFADKVKGVFSIFSPKNIKSTIKNTTKGGPLQTSAAVGSGLLDIGPRIANSVGVKNIIKASGLVTGNSALAQLTQRLPVKDIKLPLPGKTAMQYSNNTSDLSNALHEATVQAGGYELGGGALRGLGITNRVATNIFGDVIGGQATTEARGLDRGKQALADAAFGGVTAGAGALLRRTLRSKGIEPIEQIVDDTPLTQAPRKVDVVPPSNAPTKASSDINQTLVQKGFAALPTDQQALYNPTTKAATIGKIEQFVSTADAKQAAISGKTPDDFSYADRQVLFNTIEKKAIETGDIETLRNLARSPIASERSVAGQTLGASGWDNPNSPVKAIQDIQKARETTALRRNKALPKQRTEAKSLYRSAVKKTAPTPKQWATFVEQLKCK